MFARRIDHPLFRRLEKHLLSYSGVVDLPGHPNVEVFVKGSASESLNYAVAELQFIRDNFSSVVAPATNEFYGSYEAIKDAVQHAGFQVQEAGGSLPDLTSPPDVWKHLTLERIDVEPSSRLPVRLGFRAPWEVEHDLAMYLKGREFQYAGVSV